MYLCYLLIKYYIYTYSNTLARILLWIFLFFFGLLVVLLSTDMPRLCNPLLEKLDPPIWRC